MEKCVQGHVGRIRLVFLKFSLKEEELFPSFSYRFSITMRVICCSLDEHLDQNRILVEPHLRRSMICFLQILDELSDQEEILVKDI